MINYLFGISLGGFSKCGMQMEHPDPTPTFTPAVRTPQYGHTVWGMIFKKCIPKWSLTSVFYRVHSMKPPTGTGWNKQKYSIQCCKIYLQFHPQAQIVYVTRAALLQTPFRWKSSTTRVWISPPRNRHLV